MKKKDEKDKKIKKKEYSSPKIEEYGKVSELTRSGSQGSVGDTGSKYKNTL